MRFRFVALMLMLVMTLLAVPGALAQNDPATPAATPVAADTDATPIAEPTAEAVRVITLVMWYQTPADAEFVEIGPIATNNQLIAGPGDPTNAATGRIDFTSPDNSDLPRITIGDSVFDAYAPNDDAGATFRWIYFDGDADVRPATLVLQVRATEGPYKDSEGTATFSSRSNPGSGVLVIMLNPPTTS